MRAWNGFRRAKVLGNLVILESKKNTMVLELLKAYHRCKANSASDKTL